MYVCYNIIIFKTLSSPLFIFSSSQIIWHSHRLALEIVTIFYLILTNLLNKGNMWDRLSEFLKKPNPFMALIFGKKIKQGEVYSFN